MANLRTNPPCTLIFGILIWRDGGKCLPYFKKSRLSVAAVPTSFVSPSVLASCVPILSQRKCHTT